MKKIIITGAAGYIGTVLKAHLEGQGYQCSGFDAGFVRPCSIEPILNESVVFKDAREITGKDIADNDALIHLAGISNDPMKNLESDNIFDIELAYSKQLALLCKEHGVQFIYASSCSVYGAADQEVRDESSSPNPITPYSLNKLNIEQELTKLTTKSFQPICLRFATAFGFSPRMRFDIVVNMFVGMALSTGTITLNSNGQAWRPFVHIKDICQAVECAINHTPTAIGPLIVNVGATQQNYQVLEIAEMVQTCIPKTEINFLDQYDELISDRKVSDGIDKRNYRLSFEKIKSVFPGFSCVWDLRRGIEDMVEQLNRIECDQQTFRNHQFYRLQHMENLLNAGLIKDNLMWTGSERPFN